MSPLPPSLVPAARDLSQLLEGTFHVALFHLSASLLPCSTPWSTKNKRRKVTKTLDSKAREPGFESLPCYLLTVYIGQFTFCASVSPCVKYDNHPQRAPAPKTTPHSVFCVFLAVPAWQSNASICHFLPFITTGVVSVLPRRARTASILSSPLNPIPNTSSDASWEFKQYLLSEQMKESRVTLSKPGHPASSESIST